MANMATFIILRHPVTILVTVFTNPDNLTNEGGQKDDSSLEGTTFKKMCICNNFFLECLLSCKHQSQFNSKMLYFINSYVINFYNKQAWQITRPAIAIHQKLTDSEITRVCTYGKSMFNIRLDPNSNNYLITLPLHQQMYFDMI